MAANDTDTWDPKPGRPTQGEFEPIDTSVPGMQIGARIREADAQRRLVRSIAGTQGAHGRDLPGRPATASRQRDSPRLLARWLFMKRTRLVTYRHVTISGQAPRASYWPELCRVLRRRPGDKDPYLAFPEGITSVRNSASKRWPASTASPARRPAKSWESLNVGRRSRPPDA